MRNQIRLLTSSNKNIIALLMAAALVFTCVQFLGFGVYAADGASQALAAPDFPHVARASATSLKLTWTKAYGASGYEIHRYDYKAKKYKKIKTITNGRTEKWTDKKLKTGQKYVYKIRSYRMLDGKKEFSKFTYKISGVAYKKTAKIVNAGMTLTGTSSLTIGIKQILPVNVKVYTDDFGTNPKNKVVDKSIRLYLNGGDNVRGAC